MASLLFPPAPRPARAPRTSFPPAPATGEPRISLPQRDEAAGFFFCLCKEGFFPPGGNLPPPSPVPVGRRSPLFGAFDESSFLFPSGLYRFPKAAWLPFLFSFWRVPPRYDPTLFFFFFFFNATSSCRDRTFFPFFGGGASRSFFFSEGDGSGLFVCLEPFPPLEDLVRVEQDSFFFFFFPPLSSWADSRCFRWRPFLFDSLPRFPSEI